MSIHICHFALLSRPFCLLRGLKRTLHSAAPGQEEHWDMLAGRLPPQVLILLGKRQWQEWFISPASSTFWPMQEWVSTFPDLPCAKEMYKAQSWHVCLVFSFSLLLHGTVSNFLPCCHTCRAHPFILRFLWDKRRIKLPVCYFRQEFQSPFLSWVPRILPGSPRISSCRREEAEKTPIATALFPSISLHLSVCILWIFNGKS